MDVDELDYLEHFGVKGMHWGVRRDRDKSKTSHKQLATAAAFGVAVSLGGYFLGKKLGSIGTSAVRSLSGNGNTIKTGGSYAARLMSDVGKTPVSSLRNSSGAIPMGSAVSWTSRASELRDLTKKSDELRRAADVDLRRLYDLNQVPLKLREYLS